MAPKDDNNPVPINSLTGLKAIAMLLLFWWHSTIPKPNVDLGARACEFLFVTSGFLVGYNYYHKRLFCTWRSSFEYCAKKIAKFWPLHLITLFVMILYFFLANGGFNMEDISIAIANALLLHAWSTEERVYFSFNGVSWFLSALVFCYFMSPVFVRIIKKSNLIFLTFVALARYWIEYINIWGISVHTSPVVRCIEFFIGMLLVPSCIDLRKRIKKTIRDSVVFSGIELCTVILVLILSVKKNTSWPRSSFVLLFCIMIFVFSFDMGIISKILSSTPFVLFGRIQFEFFILHNVVDKIHSSIISYLRVSTYSVLLDWKVYNSIRFVLIIICAVMYKKTIGYKLSNLIETGWQRLKSYFATA